MRPGGWIKGLEGQAAIGIRGHIPVKHGMQMEQWKTNPVSTKVGDCVESMPSWYVTHYSQANSALCWMEVEMCTGQRPV